VGLQRMLQPLFYMQKPPGMPEVFHAKKQQEPALPLAPVVWELEGIDRYAESFGRKHGIQ